jgi:aryl-alcohol dehydrogenase-like predicted oxidoreductase
VEKRQLGTGGPLVSPIGFGAFKIGRNQKTKYGAHYELPGDAAVARLLNEVLDLGINYLDTAPAYGLSEERIGAAIGQRRSEYVLSTKVGELFDEQTSTSTYDFSREAIEASVRQSLQRLQTEYLDVLVLHSPGDDLGILHGTDAVHTLLALRERGVVRAVGLSAKTPEGSLAAIPWADVLMVEYHLADRSQESALEAAAAAGLGIVVKKGLSAGHLSAAEAIPFVLANRAVSSLIVGSLNAEHLRENLKLASG